MSLSTISTQISKKSRTALSDHYDVTIGSSAIFQKQNAFKEAQREDIKTRSFPSSSHDGFGFV
jgi:hypothetical protein